MVDVSCCLEKVREQVQVKGLARLHPISDVSLCAGVLGHDVPYLLEGALAIGLCLAMLL